MQKGPEKLARACGNEPLGALLVGKAPPVGLGLGAGLGRQSV